MRFFFIFFYLIFFIFQVKAESISIERIIQDESFINFYNGDKIYLKASKIELTDKGSFFKFNDNEKLMIPVLYSDVKGLYISTDDFLKSEEDIHAFRCERCKEWKDLKENLCLNERCPLYKL
jgi:hypothetical protein